MRAIFVVASLGSLLIFGWGCQFAGALDENSAEKRVAHLKLGSTSLVIEVSTELVRVDTANGVEFCRANPETSRYRNCFSFEPIATPDTLVKCLEGWRIGRLDIDCSNWESFTLKNGETLYFQTELASGGSGGDEAHLSGIVELGEHYYAIQCHQQSEMGQPAATWCLPFIETLTEANSTK